MQGSSFWKTVAIVGVIGIGSLAIIEVQNRLPKQTADGEPTTEDLAAMVAAQDSGDSTVTPELSDSEFDMMMAAAQSGDTPLFDGAEPAAEPVADATPSAALDSQFFNSDPIAPQANTPPVDTNVRMTELAQTPNPFEDNGAVTAVAANYQGEPSTAVEPVGFTGEETFPGDVANEMNAYRRENAAAPATGSPEPEPFPIFPADSGTTESGLVDTAMPLADDRPPAAIPNRTNAIDFFNGNEPGPQDSSPKTTAQFYPDEEPQLRATPDTATPNPFPELAPSSRAPAIAPAMDSLRDEILPFQNPGNGRTESAPPSEFVPETFRGDLLGPQDRVPAPRDVRPEAVPEPEFPTFNGQDFPEPERTTPTPDTSLPPIDEFDGTRSGPFAIPDINDSGRMSIPDTEPSRFDDRRREDTRPFDDFPPRETTPPANNFNDPPPFRNDRGSMGSDRRFNENSERLDIQPRPDTRRPDLNDSQPFGDRSREFDNSRSLDTPAPFNDRSREFDNSRSLDTPAPFNDRAREFDNSRSRDTPAPFNDRAREFDNSRSLDTPDPLNDRTREFDNSRSLDTPAPFNDRSREFDNSRSLDTPAPFNDRAREFGNSPRIDERDAFPSTPEISPRPRNFDSKPPTRDTRPADYDLSDRNERGGIRQVSGVMRPNLRLEKTAPKNATVGVPLNYKIYVRNEGDAPAYDVVIEDEITAGAKINGARPQPDLDRATNHLIWKFAEIAPNQTEEITVQLTPTGEGTLDGVATVKFKSRVKATTVITAPKLRIEMQGPEEVKLGDEVAYRYVITNEGSGEARDVFVRTVLPTDGGLRHPQGRDLEYEIGTMSPGQQREIVLAVVAGEPGEYRAEAIVSGTGGAKDQAGWRTNIIGAQLQIVRRGPKRRFVGKSATYENIVSNETNFDAVDARVVETIPDGMRFKGANKGGTYDDQKRTVTWRINRLAPGRQEQLQIQLMPTDAGQRESVVTVFENAGLQSENYVSTTVVEDLHNVGAQMSQLDGPVAVGETFGFTITIDNRGTADATDVELVVDVPQQIDVLAAGSKTQQAKLAGNNQVQYSRIVRIEPNQRQTFELKLKGNAPVRNKVVTAKVKYRQMDDALVVGESVTIYKEEL